MAQEDKNREPRSLEIHFGDLTEYIHGDKVQTFVILELGEDNWFNVSAVGKTPDGRTVLAIPGTSGPEFVHKIIGRYTLDQVLDGFRNLFDGNIPQKIVDSMLENSKKPSRVISY